MDTPPKTSFTYKLTDAQQILLMDILRKGNFTPVRMPYTQIAVDAARCRIALFLSGKCLIQGKGAQEFVTFVMEPQVLQEVRLGYEETLNPEAFAPHMGVDESGKGDFFGPLVIAAAYTDDYLAHKMQAMGVKDSKNISSDKRAKDLARDIRDLLGRRFAIITVGPAAYNRLYAKMRSVNTLLSWGHARAIENLLAAVPACPKAISDQFGSKEQVERALMKQGRSIELVQRHKAEADTAVAAASILARAAFLHALDAMGKTYGQRFHKGASEEVRADAAALVKNKGPTILLQTAKCHFRTTDAVLEACQKKRADLGPEGAAVSKPFVHRKKSAPAAETEDVGH